LHFYKNILYNIDECVLFLEKKMEDNVSLRPCLSAPLMPADLLVRRYGGIADSHEMWRIGDAAKPANSASIRN